MFRYLNVREELCSDEFGNYTSFGICVLKKTTNKWVEEKFISDISTDSSVVDNICKVAFSNQIKPQKLLEIIEDFI